MSREARHAPTITPESPQVPEKAQRSQRGCRSAEGSLEIALSLGRYAYTSWLIMSRTIWVTRAHLWTSLSFNYYLQIRGGTPLYRVCLDQERAAVIPSVLQQPQTKITSSSRISEM